MTETGKPVFVGYDGTNTSVYKFPDGTYRYADDQADAESVLSAGPDVTGTPFGLSRKDYERFYGRITRKRKP